MTWQIVLTLRILVAGVITHYLIKRVVGLRSRSRRLLVQYIFASLIGAPFFFWFENLIIDQATLLIGLLGVFNSIACYCHWRAVDISLSKTALLSQGREILTLLLGFYLLGELRYISSWQIPIGILLCVLGAIFLVWDTGDSDTHPEGSSRSREIVFWVAACSVIWALVEIAIRYFTFELHISKLSFVFYYYAGSLIGALLVRCFAGAEEAGETLSLRGILAMFVLSCCIWGSMLLTVWTYSLAPITVAKPIFQVSEIVLPLLLGLIVFKEVKGLRRTDWLAIGVTVAGGVLIACSFSS